jgi:hypothetical protein
MPVVPGWAPPTVPPGLREHVPGTVQAAVIVTWVCCALATLGTVVLTAGAAFLGSIVLPYFERSDRVDVILWVVGAAGSSLVACGAASACAWFVWRRRPWARVVLAVVSVLALASSVALLSPPTAFILPGAIAVLVLLFLPRSNAWFRSPSPG